MPCRRESQVSYGAIGERWTVPLLFYLSLAVGCLAGRETRHTHGHADDVGASISVPAAGGDPSTIALLNPTITRLSAQFSTAVEHSIPGDEPTVTAAVGAGEALAGAYRQLRAHRAAATVRSRLFSLLGTHGGTKYVFLRVLMARATDLQLGGWYGEAATVLSAGLDGLSRAGILPQGGASAGCSKRGMGDDDADLVCVAQRLLGRLAGCDGRWEQAVAIAKRGVGWSPRPLRPPRWPNGHADVVGSWLDDLVALDLALRRGGGATPAELAKTEEALSVVGPWAAAPRVVCPALAGDAVLQRPHTFNPALSTCTWFDVATSFDGVLAPAAAALVAAAPSLRAEWGAVSHLATRDQDCLVGNGSWARLEVTGVGMEMDGDGCAVATPAACRLLRTLVLMEGVPAVLRLGYSVLGPHSSIAPHYGASNGVVKLHLGVVVPGGGCARMRVGSGWRAWVEGGVLAFDDSFQHEVISDCGEERVVLQVVLRHPELGVEWEDKVRVRAVVDGTH